MSWREWVDGLEYRTRTAITMTKGAEPMTSFMLYLLRWQLSTPILAACIALLPIDSALAKTAMANLVGGALFYYVDRWIFRRKGESG